jgi:hypothetical protein
VNICQRGCFVRPADSPDPIAFREGWLSQIREFGTIQYISRSVGRFPTQLREESGAHSVTPVGDNMETVSLDIVSAYQLECQVIGVCQDFTFKSITPKIRSHLGIIPLVAWADQEPRGDTFVVLPDGHYFVGIKELVAVEKPVGYITWMDVPATVSG